jgi:hypothetical protein
VADGGEEGVGLVAGIAFEEVAAEMAVVLHVADHRLDRGSTPELALDSAVDAALLTRDEDPSGVWRLVAAIALVDIGALDRNRSRRMAQIPKADNRGPSVLTSVLLLGSTIECESLRVEAEPERTSCTASYWALLSRRVRNGFSWSTHE